VKGEYKSIFKFERLPHGQTKFSYTAFFDVKGYVPKNVVNSSIAGVVNR